MGAAMQSLNALNADAARAVAFNFCAHLDEHFCQIADFGLLRSVLQDRFAFSQCGRHQKVFSASDRHHVSRDTATLQARSARGQLGHHVAVLNHNLSAHGLQAFDVLVHRARANRAAAWQGHGGLPKTCQQGPKRQHRRAHGFNQLVRCFWRCQAARVDGDSARDAHLTLSVNSHVADQLEHGGHVLQAGHVF